MSGGAHLILRWVDGYQAGSQRINPDIHSRKIWGPQGPDPPAFPYIAEACVMAVFLVYCHDSNVRKSVFIAIKVFRHRRFFSPPVRNVKVVVDPAYQYLLFDA